MFGLPGGAILPVYDPLIDSSIRHILVRHEQGAGHMAEGYAHATGRPGVAMVTSGPAATNIVTPLCDAYMDSIPIVVITGQVPYSVIGTDAFQECDTVGITMPVTKHNWLITDANDIPRVDPRGVPRRDDRTPGPGARRHAEGRRRTRRWTGTGPRPSTSPATSPTRRATRSRSRTRRGSWARRSAR